MPKLAIMALLALAGCGNAYESVSVGDWRQTGSAETPTADINPLRGEVVVTRLAAGRGEKIKAGDMVQIRIGAKEGRFEGWSTYDPASASQAHVIWLWVGREPPWTSYNDFENWGHPGSARLRKALVGRAVGDQLEARLAPGAEGLIVLPLRGLGVAPHAGPDREKNRWPEFRFDGKTSVQIEVLRACEGRMLRKTATIRQFGFDVPVFGTHGPSRQGELHWSALEARCPSEQVVRLEVGPLYLPARDDFGRLMYHPHEYPNLGEKGDNREMLGMRLGRLGIWLTLAIAALLVAAAFMRKYRRVP